MPGQVGASSSPNNLITQSGGRVNIPALAGGGYSAPFYADAGWVIAASPAPGLPTTPAGLLATISVGDDALQAVTGAVIGAYDTRGVGDLGSVSALNLDTIKIGDGDIGLIAGIGMYVWNQGGGDTDAMYGVNISMESDAGTVTGDVLAIRIAAPFVSDVDGKVVGLFLVNQSTNNAAGGAFAIYYDAPDSNTFSVAADGHLQVGATITAAGTTGARTINKNAGSVNFAALAASLVVTCDKCTANSIVIATVATNDGTLKSVQAVPASGSFTLYGNAAATAETRVNFWVLNQ